MNCLLNLEAGSHPDIKLSWEDPLWYPESVDDATRDVEQSHEDEPEVDIDEAHQVVDEHKV